ncbi:MAG TPA: sigma-70 factor domain-containing protein, partial [Planctomycetota bacterium]|nr:sigma-70 factor domain-containing protein [Planctomycetota bacterium]
MSKPRPSARVSRASKPRAKTQDLRREAERDEPIEDVVRRLARAAKKGKLTHGRILTLVPSCQEDPAYLEAVLDGLHAEGIDVAEIEDRRRVGENDADDDDAWPTPDEDNDAAAIRKLDDPVRMYFSQMAEIPLLKREEEIELAKEIESSRDRLRELVYSTRLGQQKVVELLELILQKELLVEKALDVNLSKKGERHQFFIDLEKDLATLARSLRANVEDFEKLHGLPPSARAARRAFSRKAGDSG